MNDSGKEKNYSVLQEVQQQMEVNSVLTAIFLLIQLVKLHKFLEPVYKEIWLHPILQKSV